MSDRSEERNYRTRSRWEQPIVDAHAFGALTLKAAADNVRGIAELFDSVRPPLYAYLTLARAALESAVVSTWLSEPGITCLERIKRGVCEMLYSANEINELGLEPEGLERVEFWSGVGVSFGWAVDISRTKPIIDGTRRPRVSDGVVQLTGVSSDVANALYSRLSAVDHVTWFGLTSAMDFTAVQRNARTGTANVPITVDGGKVAAYTRYVVKALHAAARTRFTFMGWLDDSWHATAANAEALEDKAAEDRGHQLPRRLSLRIASFPTSPAEGDASVITRSREMRATGEYQEPGDPQADTCSEVNAVLSLSAGGAAVAVPDQWCVED